MTLPPVTVTLPGLELTNSLTGDDPYLVDLQGWYDSTGEKLDDLEWPNADGSSDQDPVYNTSRYPVVVGALTTIDDTAVFALRTQVMALKAYTGQFPMTVTDPNGTRYALVQLADRIAFTIDRTDGIARFEIPLLATDSLVYGEPATLQTGLATPGGGLQYNLSAAGVLEYGSNGNLGRVTLTNNGDATVWPSLVVQGGLTAGFYVQRLDTGQVVRYDRVVPAGSTVSVDFRTGEVLVDGDSDGSTYLTRYEFFSVAPGESVEVQFNAISGSSGTPTATFTIADGFN